MNNWLLAYQTPNDSVKYITHELSSPIFLSYNQFIEYIQTLFVFDYENFIKQLNRFKTILIDLDTHKWEIYKEKRRDYNEKELFEFNAKLEKEEEDKKIKKSERNKKFIKNKKETIAKEYNYKVIPDDNRYRNR
jgi:hypothetical protein